MKKGMSIKIFLLTSLVFFILSFIRWECGTDWQTYYDYFTHLTDLENSPFEAGFYYLLVIGDSLKSYTIALFLSGLILYYFQTKSFLQQSLLPITSCFIIFSVALGNIFFVRQSIATAILLYSIIYIREQRITPFILCVIGASLFHYSSIVFFPAWWFFNMKLTIGKMFSILVLAIIASFGIRSLFVDLAGNLSGILSYKLGSYLENSQEASLAEAGFDYTTILIKGIANKAIVLVTGILLLNKGIKQFNYYQGYLNLYIIGTVIYCITIPVSVIFIRFSFAYDSVMFFLLPLIIKLFDKKSRIIFFGILVIYLLFRLYVSINYYYDLYIPYKTIFT